MWLRKQQAFARKHIILTAAHHFVAGFGLAVVVQDYAAGASFVPVLFGWTLISVSAIVHAYEWSQ